MLFARGCIEIPSEDPSHIFQLLINPQNDSLFDETFIRGNMVREVYSTSAAMSIVWSAMNPGSMFDKRDFVYLQAVKKIPGMYVILRRSVNDEAAPPTLKYVRGHIWTSGYVIKETQDGCCITHISGVDYGGMVPTWMCNRKNQSSMDRLHGIKTFLERYDTDTDRSEALQKVSIFNQFYSVTRTARNSTDAAKIKECKELDSTFENWAKTLRVGPGLFN